MRIAIVVLGGLHPSGREQVVPSLLALCSELARNHDVHAFALRHLRKAHSYQINGYTVHDLGRPSAPAGLTRWVQARALFAAMATQGPFDVVHGFWGDPGGALAARMGRRCRIPSVATFDAGEFEALPEIDYGSQRNARGRRAIREALTATRLHVCTDFMARKVAAHGATAAVIPLTSITADATPNSRRPMRESSLRLLQIASLSRVKNQRLLIDALAILAPDLEVHLDLVGEDTLGGELQRHAETAGVSARVTFHGFVPQDQLRPILANADLYVQTSLHEAAGVSVLEAAAHGLPVIGTRVGYVADWAPDRAIAIDSADARLLASAVRALHHTRDDAVTMAARARAWVLERDAHWVAAQFAGLYTAMRAR